MVDQPTNSTIDLNRSRLKLRDGLIFVPHKYHDATFYHVESPSGFYRIGYAEYLFISLLDGETSFAEALAVSSQQLGPNALTSDQAMQTYLWILKSDLGHLNDQPAGLDNNANDARERAAGFLNGLNPFWLKVPLGCPDHLLTLVIRWLGWIFSPTATVIGSLIILIASGAAAIHWDQVKVCSDVIFTPSNWLWLGVTWFGLKFVHELAHAIACKRYGCEIGQVGIVFVLFAPMAYIDVTSSWRLASKWQRIKIASAGIFIELIIAALATLACLRWGAGSNSYLLYNLMIMASISTIVFNANPLMRFDGYFILSDLMEIPNLYQESAKSVRNQVRRFFFGRSTGPQQNATGSSIFVSVYGWLAIVWRAVICFSLAVLASTLFHGAGIILAAVGVVLWYGRPTVQIFSMLRDQYTQCRASFRRAMCAGSAVAIVAAIILLWMPTPFGVTVPGIVEIADSVHVRTVSDGFVNDVLVRDGQSVKAGDVLVVLQNKDVSNIYQGLQIEIAQTRLRRRFLLDTHQIALAQVEDRNRISLEEKLIDARRRYEGLTVRAPTSGTIFRRSLDQIRGTYVEEGETLMSIGNENSKEVVMSVSQRDFDSVVPYLGEPIHLRVGTSARIPGRLTRLEPRASTELPHAAMSATEGGSLAVVSASRTNEPRVILTESRFRGVVSIADEFADSVFCGQRGTALVGWRRQGLAAWSYQNARSWLDDKLDSANRVN